ncbi:MAG TPA: STAS domain-containing protein [Nocardioides sp.]|uniref:STAS domain-containing protein n=1 Tax=Nocardioides sp. TaxID=35761 RepID=UPI002EDAC29E
MELITDGSTVRLTGDFDVRSTWEARIAIYSLLEQYDEVVVDLSGVTTADVTALKVLAAATRRSAVQGQRVTLRGCGPAVRRLLHLSRLMRLVEVERAAASA